MEPLKILYEDAHLVICCKPVGVLSEDSESGRCMPQLLREHYLAQGQKNPYIATVHRLDKITGGVMVFSRRREVTGKLTAAVQLGSLLPYRISPSNGSPREENCTRIWWVRPVCSRTRTRDSSSVRDSSRYSRLASRTPFRGRWTT